MHLVNVLFAAALAIIGCLVGLYAIRPRPFDEAATQKKAEHLIENAKREIKAKILESYRNGVEAGKKGDRKPYIKRSLRS